jgi:hypothetical protein
MRAIEMLIWRLVKPQKLDILRHDLIVIAYASAQWRLEEKKGWIQDIPAHGTYTKRKGLLPRVLKRG